MARSDSDATSFSDEGGYSVPKRLFPAEITTMLFTSEPESDFAPETIEDASLFQLGTVPVCSVNILTMVLLLGRVQRPKLWKRSSSTLLNTLLQQHASY